MDGYLYFPTINIIITILTSLFSAYNTMMLFISSYDFSSKLHALIGFEFICFMIIFTISLYTSILFSKKIKNTFILYYPCGFHFIICNH
ncbi:hypothetical protein [Photorhabdus cinerea]|uniref:hypothetical protein n=1 Tax=Photorhabdus cinerea TaxID=471575 RepID=UPI00140A832D